ncbi:hypothetical protein [Spiroplasma endosymbiont of Sarcophaga carnaria]|uniref:hypothetical protein n=1 Tax=Spiroplasma endosymbiont of Sarcophaga carnaria TaxID=3066303 RepID=UPI0030CC3EDB
MKVSTGSNSEDEFYTYMVALHLPTDLQQGIVSTPEGLKSRVFPSSFVTKITMVHGNEHISSQGFDAIIGLDVLESGHCTIAGPNMVLSF